jgi:hypothetical protein
LSREWKKGFSDYSLDSHSLDFHPAFSILPPVAAIAGLACWNQARENFSFCFHPLRYLCVLLFKNFIRFFSSMAKPSFFIRQIRAGKSVVNSLLRSFVFLRGH